jgi:hypothetical protein
MRRGVARIPDLGVERECVLPAAEPEGSRPAGVEDGFAHVIRQGCLRLVALLGHFRDLLPQPVDLIKDLVGMALLAEDLQPEYLIQ